MSLLLTGTANRAERMSRSRRSAVGVLVGLLLSSAGSGVFVRAFAAESDPAIKTGFRIHNDWGWFTTEEDVESQVGVLEDGTAMRRARIELSGEFDERTEFKAQYDFAGGRASFKDVYLGWTDLPVVGTVRVGNQKEPFSLEELVSSNDITFLERGLPNAFAPSRHAGIQAQNTVLGERATWAAGVFRNTDGAANAKADGEYNLTARVTGLPWKAADGDLLHFGAAVSRRSPADDEVEYGARPEMNLAPEFISSGTLENVDAVTLVGGEAALVFGPFSLQSEAVVAAVESPSPQDPRFTSWYMQASLCPTGERRSYKSGTGTFGSVRPARSAFGEDGGPGAWEVALRLSRLDLEDGSVQGGSLTDYTVGVNWYATKRSRIMANYVLSHLDDVGESHMVATRFQINY